MYKDIIQNIAILIASTYFFSLNVRFFRKQAATQKIFTGIILGFIAVLSMMFSFKMSSGIIFDGRSVVLGLSGIIGGFGTAGISVLIAFIYRVIIGGDGLITGEFVIVISALIGAIMHNYFKFKKIQPGKIQVYIIGVVIHGSALLLFLTLPKQEQADYLINLWVPFLIFFPFVLVLLYYAYIDQINKTDKEIRLAESEKKFADLYENSPDMFLSIEPKQSRIVKCNQTLLNKLGLSEEEMLGQTLEDLCRFSSIESLKDILSDYERTGEVRNRELDVKGKDGAVYTVSLNLLAIKDKKGNILFGQSTMRDITEQKQLKKRLQLEKEFTELALDAQLDTFYLFEPLTGKPIRWNQTFNRVSGYTDKEIDNKLVHEFYSSSDLERGNSFIKKVMEEGAGTIELELICKNGHVIPTEYNVASIYDEKKEVKYLISIGRDISERKKVEQKLRESEEFIRTVMDNLPIGIAVNTVEPVVDFSYMNDNFAAIYRTTKEALSGPDYFWTAVYEDEEFRKQVKRKVLDDCASFDQERMVWNEILIKRNGQESFYVSARNILLPGKNLMISTVWDVTARKLAENNLLASKNRYQLLFENSPVALWEEDLSDLVVYLEQLKSDGVNNLRDYFDKKPEDLKLCADKIRILNVNQLALKLNKAYSKEELVSGLAKTFTKKSFEVFKEVVIAFGAGAESFESESETKTFEGEIRFVYLKITVHKENEGITKAFVATIDITEAKKTQDALKHSEEIFNNFMEHSPIYVFFKDKNMRTIGLSRNYEKMLDRPLEQLIGKNMNELFPSDFAEKMVADDIMTLNEGKVIRVEETFNNRLYHTIKFPIIIDGKAQYLAGYTMDVTDRIKAQEKIIKAEQHYRALVEHAPDGVVMVGTNNRISYASAAALRMFGYSEQEMSNLNPDDLTHPEDLPAVLNLLNHLLKGDIIGTPMLEYRFMTKKGGWLWIESTFSKLTHSEGNLSIVINFRNISDRKKAELKLKESERKISTLLSNLPGMAYQCKNTPEWTMEYVSNGSLELTGYEPDMLINNPELTYGQIIHPEDREQVYSKINNALDEGKQFELEYRIVDKNENVRWVWERGAKVDADQNNIAILEGFITDITQNKKAGEELRNSEKRFDYAMQASSDGIFDWNMKTNQVYFSPGYFSMLGYGYNELPQTFETYLKLLHPEDFERSKVQLADYIAGKTDKNNIEMRFKHKSGHWIWVLFRGDIVEYDENKQPLRLVGTNVDIHERKKAEEALLVEKERAQQYLDTAGVMLVAFDVSHKIILINPKGCEILGYEKEQLIGQYWYEKFIPDEYKIEIKEEFKSLISGVISANKYNETPIIRKGGEQRTIAWNNSLIKDKNGNITGLLSSGEDISERKLVQQKILEANSLLTSIIESQSDIIIFSLDTDYCYTAFNSFHQDEMKRIYNVDIKIGACMLDYISINELKPIIKKTFERVVEGESFSEVQQHPGTEIYYEFFWNPIFQNEKISGFTCLVRDISTRIKIEQQLKQSEEKYRLLTLNSVDVIWQMDLRLNYKYISPSIFTMLGYTPEDWTDTNMSAHTSRLEFIKVARQMINAINNHKKVRTIYIESKLFKKNGKEIPVEIIGRLLYDQNGNPDSIQGSTRDISDRKKSEARLRENENFQNTLLQSIPIPVYYKDINGKYLGFNRAFEDFYGLSKNALIGKNIFDINPTELAQKIHAKDKELLKNGGVQVDESQLKNANGIKKTVIFNKAVFTNKKGEISGLIGTILDITDLKQVEDELLVKNEELTIAKEYLEEREEQLKEAQSMAKLGNWTLNLETNQFSWSDEIYHIFQIGKNVRNIAFETFINSVYRDDRELLLATYREHLLSKKPFDIIHRIYLPGGMIKYVHEKCFTEFNLNGEAIKSRGTMQDVTELKLTEEKLLKLNTELGKRVEERTAEISKLSEAVIHSPANVIITNTKGEIEYVNPKFTEVTGYTEEEILGENPRILNSGFHEKMFFENLWKTIKAGKVWKGEICNKIKSGEIIWENVSISSIKNKNSKITHFVAVREDITRKKKMEKELEKAKEIAEAANLAKSEFLANMSHEIRTPMNSVLGFAELLSNMVESDIQKSYLESIKSSGKNLLTIINDILDLSKIEAGKLVLEYNFIDIRAFFDEIKSIFSLTSEEKGVKFYVNISDEVPQLMYLDEIRLHQVIINILGNAFKFTAKGYVKVILSVINKKANDETGTFDLRIDVSDTGIGIQRDSISEIFESFHQQEGQNTKKYGGTGLGLSITKKLVHLMNGEIDLKSKVNKGSTFSLIFKQIKFSDDKSEVDESKLFELDSVNFVGSTILIVDDTSDNRKYLAGALMKYNLNVLEAADGHQALSICRMEKPQLIITDIRMPKMNGFELLKNIKKIKALKDVPIIAATASVMPDSIGRIKTANFSGILKKPFQVNELLKELVKHLPFDNLRQPIDEGINDLSINDTNIRNVDEFIKKLNFLDTLFISVKEYQSMDEISSFSNECIAIAEEFRIKPLFKFGNSLQKAIESFDVELILGYIKTYPQLLNKIKTAVI